MNFTNISLDTVQSIFGNDILLAIIFLFGGILLSKFVHFFLNSKVKKLVEKTKTDIDDILLDVFETPIENTIIVVAIYLAISTINIFSQNRGLFDNLFFVVLALLVAQTLVRLASFFVKRWIHVTHKKHEKSPQIIDRVLGATIYLLAFLVILGHFQIEITPMIAALGVGGLAVGLALQDNLSNFFAGVYIVSGSPIRVGDFIEIPSEKVIGYVEDISWRETKIRTLPNTIVFVPNSKLSQSIVVNTYLPDKEVAVPVDCGVAYHSDLEKVERVTTKVAQHIQQSVPGAVKTFKPFIRYKTFGDSNINFTIILRAEEYVSGYLITHELIKALKKEYDKEGIEISYPARNIFYRTPLAVEKQKKKG